jgi:hypothetical protein
VSQSAIQIVAAAFLSFIFAGMVYRLARIGRLSFRYTVGWLTLSMLGLLAGFFVPIVQPIAEFLKLSPAALLALLAVVLLVSICIQLSISISGVQEQLRSMAEKVALLRTETDENRDNQ